MRRIIFVVFLLNLLTLLPASAQDCGLPPRLTAGAGGRVIFTDGQPLNLRFSAGISADVSAIIPEGSSFAVLEGPVCADGIYWWNITGTRNEVGWIAEGVESLYFVEPISPEQFVIDQALVERLSTLPDVATLVLLTTNGDLRFTSTSFDSLFMVPSIPAVNDARVYGNEVYYTDYSDQIVIASLTAEPRALVPPTVEESGIIMGYAPAPAITSPEGNPQIAWLFDLTPVDPTFDGCFAEQGCVGRIYALILADSSGENAREIWRGTIGEPFPYYQMLGWRADGEAILLSRTIFGVASGTFPIEGGGIIEIALDGTERERSPLTDRQEAISPDGQFLAQTAFGERLVTVIADGAAENTFAVPFTEDAFDAGLMRFSPDSRYLVWAEITVPPQNLTIETIIFRALNLETGNVLPLWTFALRSDDQLPMPSVWLSGDPALENLLLVEFRGRTMVFDAASGGAAVWGQSDSRIIGSIIAPPPDF